MPHFARLIAVSLGLLAGAAGAQDCEPQWAPALQCPPSFHQGSFYNNSIHEAFTFDDGSGPAVYVFDRSGVIGCDNAINFARWDGRNFFAVEGSPSNIDDLLGVFDLGQGSELVGTLRVSGEFEDLIAWNGDRWRTVAALQWPAADLHLTSLDLGDGPALYTFQNERLFKLNGDQWTELTINFPSGTTGVVTFDDGDGTDLYITGEIYYTPSLELVDGMLRWTNPGWEEVETIPAGDHHVFTLDQQGNEELFIAGGFGLLHWAAGTWEEVPGLSGSIYLENLRTQLHGSAPELLLTGSFSVIDEQGNEISRNAAVFDGERWQPLFPEAGVNVPRNLRGAVRLPDPAGDRVLVWGEPRFDSSTQAGLDAESLLPMQLKALQWRQHEWATATQGLSTIDTAFRSWVEPISSVVEFDDGSGPSLVAAGDFYANGPEGNVWYIARWNGDGWVPMGSGRTAPVTDLLVIPGDEADTLYAAHSGYNNSGLGDFYPYVSRWTGEGWEPVGEFPRALYFIDSLAEFEGDIIAGGSFRAVVDGQLIQGVTRWDGSAWQAMGDGFRPNSWDGVRVLKVLDLGNGPELFAGGVTLGLGSTPRGVHRWTGSHWELVGNEIRQIVLDLHVHDDGSGPLLYAAGNFEQIVPGQGFHHGISKLVDGQWVAVSDPSLVLSINQIVRDLETFDDGTGPALYALGQYQSTHLFSAENFARWDGQQWESVGGGIIDSLGGLQTSGPTSLLKVSATHFGGPALIATGHIEAVDEDTESPRSHLAVWLGCEATAECPFDLANSGGAGAPDGIVDAGDFLALSFLAGPCGAGTPNPECTGDFADSGGFGDPDGVIDFGDFFAMSFAAGPCP